MWTGFFVSHKSLLSPHTKEEWAKGYRGLTKETMKRRGNGTTKHTKHTKWICRKRTQGTQKFNHG
jgi:hypothetical protein